MLKSKTRQTTGLALALLLGLLSSTSAITFTCGESSFLYFPRSAQEPKCLPFPIDKCSGVSVDDEVVKCTSCARGYYLDKQADKTVCSPCDPNCSDCQGPGIDNCSSLKTGKRYDPIKKELYTCAAGCGVCDRDQNCISCNPGYRTEERLQLGAHVVINGHATVECYPCKIEGCEYCSKANNTLGESCTMCKSRNGPHRFSGKCMPCPLNCMNCFSDNMVCDYCDMGYYRNPVNSQCAKIQEPNCINFDGQRNRCQWCMSGYTLEHSTGKCVSCSTIDPLCSQCGYGIGPPTTGTPPPMVCHSCIQEHYFDTNTKKCTRCSEHCDFCGQDGACLSCKPGFSLNAGKCFAINSPGCTYARDGKCMACDTGYYLDQATGTCKKCANGCLSCLGEGTDHCMWCPVTRLSIRPQFNNPVNFPGTVKPAICILRPQSITCADSCKDPVPDVDLLSGDCIKSTDPVQPPKNKYAFSISPRSSTDPETTVKEILTDTFTYIIELNNYNMKSRVSAQIWAAQNQNISKNWSPRCNYRGELIQQLNFEREAYFECDCRDGYTGLDCAISREEYHSIQKHVTALLTELETYMRSPNQDIWLQAFINLNAGSHSAHTLDRLTEALKEYTVGHSKIMLQPQSFLAALDTVFRSNYRHHLEAVRDLNTKRFDTSESDFLKSLFDRVHKLIHIGRDTLRRSLPLQKETFSISRSEAFQVSYTLPTKAQATAGPAADNMILAYPPNMMGSSHVADPVAFNLNCAAVRNQPEKFFITAWAFSNLLFSKTIYDGMLMSYVTAFDVNSDTVNPAVCAQPGDRLVIRFPLRIEPSQQEQLKVRCLGMNFDVDKVVHKYTEIKAIKFGFYDESRQPYVECDFGAFEVTSETFFTVGYEGKKDNFHTEKLDRVAMDTGDDYPLKDYSLPSAAAGLLQLTTLACMILAGIWLN